MEKLSYINCIIIQMHIHIIHGSGHYSPPVTKFLPLPVRISVYLRVTSGKLKPTLIARKLSKYFTVSIQAKILFLRQKNIFIQKFDTREKRNPI